MHKMVPVANVAGVPARGLWRTMSHHDVPRCIILLCLLLSYHAGLQGQWQASLLNSAGFNIVVSAAVVRKYMCACVRACVWALCLRR